MMNERHSIMLRELEHAITLVLNKTHVANNSRTLVLAELRLQHHLCSKAHCYVEAWCIHGVIQMIDDSPMVNDVLRELRALAGPTPHSNRGVTSPSDPSTTTGGNHE